MKLEKQLSNKSKPKSDKKDKQENKEDKIDIKTNNKDWSPGNLDKEMKKDINKMKTNKYKLTIKNLTDK